VEKTRIKYKKISNFTGVGYEVKTSKSIVQYELSEYRLNNKRHRTEGPAQIYKYSYETEEYYYIDDIHIYQDGLELFHKLNKIPLNQLPLHINKVPDLHLSIIKERLSACI